MIYGSIVLFSCLILLAVGNWTKLPIWLVTFGAAILSLTRDIVYDIVIYCRRHRRHNEYGIHQQRTQRENEREREIRVDDENRYF